MKHARASLFTALAAMMALAGAAAPAWGVTYGNPAHDVKSGQIALGFVYEDHERTFEFEGGAESDLHSSVIGISAGFGIANAGLLSFTVGAVSFTGDDVDKELTGVEGTIAYRHNFDFADKLDEGADPFQKFRKGLIAAVRIGNAEDPDGNGIDYFEYDLGFGVGTNVIRQVQAYGGGVLSIVSGTGYSEAGSDYSVDSSDWVGVFAGMEWAPQETLIVGAEIHLVHEWGFGLYVEFLP
jgi:hypothetical protein